MSIIVDTHVHLWPGHEPAVLLEHLVANLSQPDDGAMRAAVLVDGRGCDGFGRLAALGAGGAAGRFAIRRGPDALALDVVAAADGRAVLRIIGGRQIVTAERIEVLALGTRAPIADGEAAERTLDAVFAAQALPVLAWAPGKWFGERGDRVAALIRRFSGRPLLLGDTSLRAMGWPTPRLMRDGLSAGLGRVCGSDPLPPSGEERQAGRYATRLEGALDAGAPVRSLLARLGATPPAGGWPCVGRRCSPTGMLLRLLRHAAARRVD